MLLQGYPNLEYIIIDGGSTDNSVDIIKKYEPWLAYWVSEKDRGQSHAINKGFEHSTGSIMAWINSDDYYAPQALQHIAQTFTYERSEWVAGRCNFIDENGDIKPGWGKPREKIEAWFVGPLVMQPGTFWKRNLWKKSNHIDETLTYAFDYELWFQFVKHQPFPFWVNTWTANFRIHSTSKTFMYQERFRHEDNVVHKKYEHLISRTQKKYVNILRREHRAKKILWGSTDSRQPALYKISYALFLSPWFLFRRSFYGRIRQLILRK